MKFPSHIHQPFDVQDLGFSSCQKLAKSVYHQAGIMQSLESLLKTINKAKHPPAVAKSLFSDRINNLEDVHKLYNKASFVLRTFLQSCISEEKEIVINKEKINHYEKIFDKIQYYYKNKDYNNAKLVLMQENFWREPHWLDCKKALRDIGVPLYAVNGFQSQLISNAHSIAKILIQEKKEENPYYEMWKKFKPELIQSLGMGGIVLGVGHYFGTTSIGIFLAGALSTPIIEALKGKGVESFKKFIGATLIHKTWNSRVRNLNRFIEVIDDYYVGIQQKSTSNSIKLRSVLEKLSTHNDKLSLKNTYLMNEELFVPQLAKDLEKVQQATCKFKSQQAQQNKNKSNNIVHI